MKLLLLCLVEMETKLLSVLLNQNYSDNLTEINPLSPEDAVLDYGQLGNFSLAGFEMVLTRYVSTYIITYYLPSGT